MWYPPYHVPERLQFVFWQYCVQPSPPIVLPSSQVSPDSMTPLPQTFGSHAFEQPSPSRMLPSSHCSPAWTTPSPHRATWQATVQSSSFEKLPSSHASQRGLTTPSPQ